MEMANPDGNGTVAKVRPIGKNRVIVDAEALLKFTKPLVVGMGYHLWEANGEVDVEGDGQYMIAIYLRVEPT
jgi:hypothetical protein